MKYILDTHVFFWWVNGEDESISEVVHEIIKEPSNELYLSIASVWEMMIKCQIGKLELPEPYEEFITNQLKINGISLLPVNIEHACGLQRLPLHHRDPFDRMILSQAACEEYTILSKDCILPKYEVRVIW